MAGESLRIKGEITANEDLRFEGEIEGTISVPEHTLVVGRTARISADVHAKSIVVAGSLMGSAVARERCEVQEAATLEGTMTTELGTVQVTDGRITGQRVTFTITLPISGQTTTIVFQGTVDGNRMTGTADLGAMGSATFTGERKP